MRTEIQQLHQEVEAMRRELNAMRSAQAAQPAAPNVAEEQQLLNAKIEDQYQTKVESGSRYRMRISGLALLNVFGTRGSVDNIDLPRNAALRNPGDSNGAFGASARQSRLNFEILGPEWRGAKATGNISLDFFGGFPSTPDGTSAGLVRLRTATLRLDAPNTSILAGQDVPFFSPRSPTSIASSAYPPLSSAGNIWVWTPQVEIENRFVISHDDKFSIQGGILDPFTGELPQEYNRIPTAGERSRIPAYATRFGWQHTADDRVSEAGIGAYYSRQNWGFERTVDSWTATADWDIPLYKAFSLSGEFYRGRAIGGLGAGASPSILFKGSSPISPVLAVDSVGGWAQLKFKPVERVEFNGAYGEDQPFRADLNTLLAQRLIEGTPTGRNAGGFFNVIYQPRSNLLFSVEYRRLWTTGLYDPKRTADHVSFTSGIVF
jgi:hypothetical protein